MNYLISCCGQVEPQPQPQPEPEPVVTGIEGETGAAQ